MTETASLPLRIFVTATGTDVGKTWLGTGLVRHLRSRGRAVAALKPMETGCLPSSPDPDGPLTAADAIALAEASGRPEHADWPGFYRARRPLAPWAATAMGEPPPPSLASLVSAIEAAALGADDLLVEGAGGVLVPIDHEHDLVDLARLLDLPLLLASPDVLGTLSATRTAVEAAERRGVRVAAVALIQSRPTADLSAETNAELLRRRLACPVLRFAHRPEGPAASELDELLRALHTPYHT